MCFSVQVIAESPSYYYMYRYFNSDITLNIPAGLLSSDHRLGQTLAISYYVKKDGYDRNAIDLEDLNLVTTNRVCYAARNKIITPDSIGLLLYKRSHLTRISDNYMGHDFYLNSSVFNSKEVFPEDVVVKITTVLYLFPANHTDVKECIGNNLDIIPLGETSEYFDFGTDAVNTPITVAENNCCTGKLLRDHFLECSKTSNIRNIHGNIAKLEYGVQLSNQVHWKYEFKIEYACYSPVVEFPNFHYMLINRDYRREQIAKTYNNDIYKELNDFKSFLIRSYGDYNTYHKAGYQESRISQSPYRNHVQGHDYFIANPAYLARLEANYCNGIRVFSNLDMRNHGSHAQPRGVPVFNENRLDALSLESWELEARLVDVYEGIPIPEPVDADFVPILHAEGGGYGPRKHMKVNPIEHTSRLGVNLFLDNPSYQSIAEEVHQLFNWTIIGPHAYFLQDHAYFMWKSNPPLNIRYNPANKANKPKYTLYQFRVKENYRDIRAKTIYSSESAIPLSVGGQLSTILNQEISFVSAILKDFIVYPELDVSQAEIRITRPCISNRIFRTTADTEGEVNISKIEDFRGEEQPQGYTYEVYGYPVCAEDMYDIVQGGTLNSFVNTKKDIFPVASSSSYEADMEVLRLQPGYIPKNSCNSPTKEWPVRKYNFSNTFKLPSGIYWVRAIPYSPILSNSDHNKGAKYVSNVLKEVIDHSIWGQGSHWLNGGEPIVIYPEECYSPYCVTFEKNCEVLQLNSAGESVVKVPVHFSKSGGLDVLKTGLEFCINYDENTFEYIGFTDPNNLFQAGGYTTSPGKICFNELRTNAQTGLTNNMQLGTLNFRVKIHQANIFSELRIDNISLEREQATNCGNTSLHLRSSTLNYDNYEIQELNSIELVNVYRDSNRVRMIFNHTNPEEIDTSSVVALYLRNFLYPIATMYLPDSNAFELSFIYTDSLDKYSQTISVNLDSLNFGESSLLMMMPADTFEILYLDSIYGLVIEDIDSTWNIDHWQYDTSFIHTLVWVDTAYSDTSGYQYVSDIVEIPDSSLGKHYIDYTIILYDTLGNATTKMSHLVFHEGVFVVDGVSNEIGASVYLHQSEDNPPQIIVRLLNPDMNDWEHGDTLYVMNYLDESELVQIDTVLIQKGVTLYKSNVNFSSLDEYLTEDWDNWYIAVGSVNRNGILSLGERRYRIRASGL